MILVLLGALAIAAPGDVERGTPVYAQRCAQCHGDHGDGDGPAAAFVYPRPRVFTTGSYKLRTTPSGELPTDDDLFAVITRGMPGSAMPSFAMLPEQERWDLVAVVKSMCPDFADPSFTAAAVPVPAAFAPEPPPLTPASVDRGRGVYANAGCPVCHGAEGRGDGTSWTTTTDDWGNRDLPADLHQPDRFRRGDDVIAVFRTLTTGLNGAPMPSYADALTEAQRWDLAAYVISLGPPADQRDTDRVIAKRVAQVPVGVDDPAWRVAAEARFATLPNLIEPPRNYWPAVPFVTVQALYDDADIAILVAWDDCSHDAGTDLGAHYDDRDGAIYTDTHHPDQLAVQFPSRPEPLARPFLLFGDGRRSVDLWWWRSDDDAITARTARGSGRMRDEEPAVTAGIAHRSRFADGRYALLLKRARSAGPNDPSFEPGDWMPLSVHVWDGSRGEVGGRHAFTRWRWLILQEDAPASATYGPVLAFFLTLAGLVAGARRYRSAMQPPPSGAQ